MNLDENVINEVNEAVENQKLKNIFSISRKINLSVEEDGVEPEGGYQFEVDTAIPELAFAIAQFAKVLPSQGVGESSDTGFIQLINQYFNQKEEQ